MTDDQIPEPAATISRGNGQGPPPLSSEPDRSIPDPGNEPRSKYAAAKLHIPGGGIRKFTNVIPDYPREYCRAFPERMQEAWLLDLKTAKDLRKKLWLMPPEVVDAGGLEGVSHKAFLAACIPMIDRDSHPHLWCVRIVDKDGNQTEIYDSAMRAAEAAAGDWHRIWWALRGFDFERARNPEAMSYRMPDNLKPDAGMDGWFEGAFPGRIFRDPYQEELKRLRGEA
jgi:hypothetical protein